MPKYKPDDEVMVWANNAVMPCKGIILSVHTQPLYYGVNVNGKVKTYTEYSLYDNNKDLYHDLMEVSGDLENYAKKLEW